MKKLFMSALAAVAIGAALPAAAQFQKPEDAIKYRRGAMVLMNVHMGRIGAMANGRVPFDAAAAADNAALVALISKLPYVAFVEGSDKGETRAKPEIWSERAKFDTATKETQDNLVKLEAAAKSGSVEQLKAAFGPAAQSCKACHDNYRKD